MLSLEHLSNDVATCIGLAGNLRSSSALTLICTPYTYMPTIVTGFLGFFSLLAVLIFYFASSDISENLSPQGCRMSWMSPSYVQQTNFNASWSPLSRRYSLWLYREVGWDSLQVGICNIYAGLGAN